MPETRSSIVVIDSSPAIAPLLRCHLEGEAIDVYWAASAHEGMDKARQVEADLILLDSDLADTDAFDALKWIKDDAHLGRVAVILMAGPSAHGQKLRGLDLGAFDYLSKPFDAGEVRARVRCGLRMQFMAQLLSSRSMIDSVTGLRNHDYFDQRLQQELAMAVRSGHRCACILLDIDGFSLLNQTYGHRIGDEVLRQVASVFKSTCRSEDILCRYAGGKFVVLAPDASGEQITHLALRMREKLEASRVSVRGGTIHVTASFGIAEVSHHGAERVVQQARAALDKAKAAGGNCVRSADATGDSSTQAA
ncbi:MAG: diguanylate cyclase [Phycisphaerales bacterium]|nr:diguanylate cyclase [Phycisphaerales bacterium]